MSDFSGQIFGKVSSDLDPLKKILSYIPGFRGYVERQSRRDADKMLRDTIASRFEELWQRISSLQRDFISQGEISNVDDLERSAIKLRTFIDRLRRAPRGYSGLFDAVKIGGDELTRIYEYDSKMLELVDATNRAIDHVATSVGSDGLPAAIRNLETIASQCVEVYDKRSEVVFGVSSDSG